MEWPTISGRVGWGWRVPRADGRPHPPRSHPPPRRGPPRTPRRGGRSASESPQRPDLLALAAAALSRAASAAAVTLAEKESKYVERDILYMYMYCNVHTVVGFAYACGVPLVPRGAR